MLSESSSQGETWLSVVFKFEFYAAGTYMSFQAACGVGAVNNMPSSKPSGMQARCLCKYEDI